MATPAKRSAKKAGAKKSKRKAAPVELTPWEQHLRAPGFRSRLRQMVIGEIDAVCATPLAELLAPSTIENAIAQIDPALVDVEFLTEVVLEARQKLAARLGRHSDSLADLLGEDATSQIASLFEARGDLPEFVDEIVRGVLEHEFIRRLLTDLIYTAIAAFYRKVNPLFGGMATRMLEDQIKGFIRLFMPTLQQQAVSFATSRDNQRALMQFAGALVQGLLEEPLSTYGKVLRGGDSRRLRNLIRAVVHAPELNRLAQQQATELCGFIFERYGETVVGELVAVGDRSGWLADQVDELLQAALERPAIVAFVQAELLADDSR